MESRFGREHWNINNKGEPEPIEEPTSFKLEESRFQAEREENETKEFIRSIDFTVLKKIFEEEYKKAGADPSKMNFVAPEHISNQTSFGALGVHTGETNIIGMDLPGWSELAKKRKWDERLLLLTGLSHEETHAVAKNDIYHDKAIGYAYTDSGYEKNTTGMNEGYYGSKPYKAVLGSIFHDFNEGVTDKIGLEIMSRYAEQTNYADTKSIDEFVSSFRQHSPYARGQHMVDVFINKLSASTGLSKDTVWGAIKSGAITGDDLYSGELREFLNEELGAEYMKRLETGSPLKTDRPKQSALEQKVRNGKAWLLKLSRKFTRK